ncbi:MAG TPA: glycine cleavage system aminomethyltransferase GcvT [Thermopetrobacter sp.]|nr:glycine cleavage system aminomethyltransferase GcvT [Thermopetrobacter sp.]
MAGGTLNHTPLHALHLRLGAKMAPFAGHDMPVQYAGIIAEHEHTRAACSLFDVSHMGQARLAGADFDTLAAFMERLTPALIKTLKPGRQRYTMFTNAEGGIIDDLMVQHPASAPDELWLVVNASRKEVDYAWIEDHLPAGARLIREDDRALLALQGPKAEAVLARHFPPAADLTFMQAAGGVIDGMEVRVTRCGYTGEDGYEISVPAERAEELAERLLAEPEVEPAGLGARDTLRLEAGLCLYGNDIDETTSPVEANLTWSIGKRRREQGGFIGEERILKELQEGPARKLMGIRPEGRAPARAGTEVFSADGEKIGHVTSGGYGPTVGGPVAMGYVRADHATEGAEVILKVRGRDIPAQVASAVFVPHNYKR